LSTDILDGVYGIQDFLQPQIPDSEALLAALKISDIHAEYCSQATHYRLNHSNYRPITRQVDFGALIFTISIKLNTFFNRSLLIINKVFTIPRRLNVNQRNMETKMILYNSAF